MNALTVVAQQPEGGAEDADRRLLEGARAIVQRLQSLVQAQMTSKKIIEERWLEDLRNYYGIYPANVLADLTQQQRSKLFVKLTRHKTDGWAARLSDMLFPTDDKNWGIQPTPVPMLHDAAADARRRAQQKVDQANAQHAAGDSEAAQATVASADPDVQLVQQIEAENAEAKRRAKRMEEAIEDQFVESDYNAQCRRVIEDGCRLGTGILKGPMTAQKLRRQWKATAAGWTLEQSPDPHPEFKRVDPWHFFPDMSANTPAEAEFFFERSLPTKKDLRKLALKLGFDKRAVRELLKEGPGETPGSDLTYISNLKDITNEGFNFLGRYVMWEYHGPLEPEEIADLIAVTTGREEAERFLREADPLEDQRVIIHFCNGEVLKIAPYYPLDSCDPLYSVWNFARSETTMFGHGIPYIMADSQSAINGAWRQMMDNGGLSTGPQILADKQAIEPQDGTWGLKPFKMWLMTSAGRMGTQPAMQVFNVPNNQEAYQNVIQLAKAFADEETSAPPVEQGDVGAPAQTLGGLSMIMNSANVLKRRVVKSFDDDLTKPTIRRAYDWNMQFNPDDSIKGDMQVDARGSSVLLARELQAIHAMNVAQNWSAHPVLGPYVKPRDAMKMALKALMIDDNEILRTEDEAKSIVDAQVQAAQQANGGGGDMQLRLQIAQEENASREKVAQMQQQTAFAELALRERVSMSDLQARFAAISQQIQSKERMKAADIGVEDRRAREAAARGTPEQDAVGVGVG